jgi:hypothetical protein
MLAAGTVVGLIYDHAGLASILAIDGLTYVFSALCFYHLRKGRVLPHAGPTAAPVEAEVAERAILALETSEPSPAVFADITEGLRYLRAQPSVLALGLTYATMMAGVISANVIVVALAHDLLHAGARGYGFLQAGWALGAVAGGLAALSLPRERPRNVLIAALVILALGHAIFPYAGFLVIAVAMNAVFGACRAIGAVLTQSSILRIVPQHLMGRTQSAFALIATVLQIVMSFTLGWLAEHTSLEVAFVLLGMMYAMAVVAAARTTDPQAGKIKRLVAKLNV